MKRFRVDNHGHFNTVRSRLLERFNVMVWTPKCTRASILLTTGPTWWVSKEPEVRLLCTSLG